MSQKEDFAEMQMNDINKELKDLNDLQKKYKDVNQEKIDSYETEYIIASKIEDSVERKKETDKINIKIKKEELILEENILELKKSSEIILKRQDKHLKKMAEIEAANELNKSILSDEASSIRKKEMDEEEEWDKKRLAAKEALTDPAGFIKAYLQRKLLEKLELTFSKKKQREVREEREKSELEEIEHNNELIEKKKQLVILQESISNSNNKSDIDGESISNSNNKSDIDGESISNSNGKSDLDGESNPDILNVLEKMVTSTESTNDTLKKQLKQDKDQFKKDQTTSAAEEVSNNKKGTKGGVLDKLSKKLKKGKGGIGSLLGDGIGDGIGELLENKFGGLKKLKGFFGKGKGKGLLGKGKGLLGKGKGLLPKGLGMLKHIPKFGMGMGMGGMGGIGSALASGGSAVASGATAAAGAAGSAMSGVGALAAANPIGASILAAAAIGAGGYMLWDSMRGSDKAKEAFDAAEDAGLVDHDVIGDSEILDWEGIKKLSPKAIDGLIEYDDWSDEDMKRLKEIKETGDFDDGSKKREKKEEEKEKIDDSTSSEGLSTNPPPDATGGVLGKLFDYSPLGMMSNALGFTTSESDKEKQRKTGNLDYTDKLDTIISLMGGKEISTKKAGYFGVGAEGDMPGDFNKGKSLLDYKDFDDFEANAPEALKSEHFDIMDNEDFNLSKREARMESKLANNMPGFNGVDSGVPGKGVKTKNLIAGAEKGTPETEWMRSLGLKSGGEPIRGGLLSGIGSFFTGKGKDGKDESTLFEKAYDKSTLGGITNMLGLTTSESDKSKDESIPKNDAEQIKLNYKEGSAQEKKASEEIKKLRGENANIDYGDEFGTNIEFKNPEVQKNYDRLLKLEQAGRLQKNQAVDAQAQSMMNESTGMDTDDQLYEKFEGEGRRGDMEIEAFQELRNKMFLENEGISEDETGQNWKNEQLIDDMAENSLKEMLMPEQVQHDVIAGAEKGTETYSKSSVLASQTSAPEDMTSHNGESGKWNQVGDDWIFYSNRTEDFERKKKIPNNVIAGAEKGTPETEFVEKFRNEYGENDKLMGGGLMSRIGSFFTGKSEDGKDKSTLFEKAYDNSMLGGITNFLGLTTSESDKEKSITEEGQSTDTDSVAPLNDSVTGKLTDQEYLDDIQSYKDRIMSWGKGDMTDLVTMNDGTIIDYSYWRGQKYKWHDGDLTEMYKKLKSGQEIKIGMNAIPKDDEHLNPFNPSFYTDKKMNNTSNILASNIKVGNEMPQVIPNKENVQRKSNLVSSALQKGMDNKIAGTQSQNNGSSSSQTNISAPTINNNTTIKKEGTHDTDVTTRGLNKSAMMSLNDDF